MIRSNAPRPNGVTLTTAPGFPLNTLFPGGRDPTSTAFFRHPGIDLLYSGVAKSSASARRIRSRNSTHARGGVPSRDPDRTSADHESPRSRMLTTAAPIPSYAIRNLPRHRLLPETPHQYRHITAPSTDHPELPPSQHLVETPGKTRSQPRNPNRITTAKSYRPTPAAPTLV